MDIEDGQKITEDAKLHNNALTYGRIDKARKTLAKVLNQIEALKDEVEFACHLAEWNDEVVFQIGDAAKELGFALATLTTWDDEPDEPDEES